jgi:hypothetical protein
VGHAEQVGVERSTHKYSERVEAILAPSRRARLGVAAAVAVTSALVCATPLALELRGLAACAIALAAVRASRALRGTRRLRVDCAGEVFVDEEPGRLAAGSFVAPWLSTVRWRPEGRRIDRALLVLPDMLPAEDYRRLRTILKLSGRDSRAPP